MAPVALFTVVPRWVGRVWVTQHHPVEYVEELSAHVQRYSFTEPERTSEVHVFVDLMGPAIIVVIPGAGADGSRRYIHPCRWVEDRAG